MVMLESQHNFYFERIEVCNPKEEILLNGYVS